MAALCQRMTGSLFNRVQTANPNVGEDAAFTPRGPATTFARAPDRMVALDGLRGLAVLSVIIFHAFDERVVPGGFIGVDIFFVLSGFLITRSLVAEYHRTGTISLWRFHARRACRLVPALCAVLVFYSAVVLWCGLDPSLSARRIAAAGLYFMNWLRAFQIDGGGALGHAWSLGIEEQFYLLWPITFLVAARGRRMTPSLVSMILFFFRPLGSGARTPR